MSEIPPGLVAGMCAVLGLMIGSFLNVVAHRVPRGESVVSPPSACPGCGEPIRARHNVPVLGWLRPARAVLRLWRRDQCAVPPGGGRYAPLLFALRRVAVR